MLTDPRDGLCLPDRVALGAVNAHDVDTGFDQRRHALGIVAAVDARTYHVALVLVEHLERIRFMLVVVLAEDHVGQVAVVIKKWQRIELVLPNDVVGQLE